MHLALVIDDYLPHSTRVGAKMFHELAVELYSLGHEVTVITPDSNLTSRFSEDRIDGIKIWRFRSGPTKDIGKIRRAINETLLSSIAWSVIKTKVKSDTFDGVIYYSPSIFFGGLVKKLKRRCSCKAYLVLRDFFPQWAIDAGMIRKGSSIERYFRFFESYSYHQADMIGLMSEKNKEVFSVSNKKIFSSEILRNWANLTPYLVQETVSSIRHQYGLEDKVIFFYGGNIGHAQDMANLMRLAKAMRHQKDAHFLFVGQGDEVKLINNLAIEWELLNYTYLPSVNQQQFKGILAEIDIGLFSLSIKHSAYNFPGKLLGYMVQSVPILGSVNEGNDLLELVNMAEAGIINVNGNDEKLLIAANALYENKKLRNELGQNAYRLLEDEFSVSSAAETIVKQLIP